MGENKLHYPPRLDFQEILNFSREWIFYRSPTSGYFVAEHVSGGRFEMKNRDTDFVWDVPHEVAEVIHVHNKPVYIEDLDDFAWKIYCLVTYEARQGRKLKHSDRRAPQRIQVALEGIATDHPYVAVTGHQLHMSITPEESDRLGRKLIALATSAQKVKK